MVFSTNRAHALDLCLVSMSRTHFEKHEGVLHLPDSIKQRTGIYEHKHNGDQTLSFPKEILKNLCVRVGTLYVLADFMVIETGNDERAPIILGRPFLNTRGAIIYASAAKISFYIKGRKEIFFFRNKTTQIPDQSRRKSSKRTNMRNRNKQVWTESAKMVTVVHGGQDHQMPSI